MKLEWHEIKSLSSFPDVYSLLDEYPHKFSDGLGVFKIHIKGVKIKIHIDANARPVFCRFC